MKTHGPPDREAAHGNMDLGSKMSKTMVVRAWNDAHNNGKQDDGEEGGENLTVLRRDVNAAAFDVMLWIRC
jgi:hypothetical protein